MSTSSKGAKAADAAALQDSLARRYNLSTPKPKAPTSNSKQQALSPAQQQQQKRSVSENQASAAPKVDIICSSCNRRNGSDGNVCSHCGYFLHSSIVTVSSQQSTLAERRGLVRATASIAASTMPCESDVDSSGAVANTAVSIWEWNQIETTLSSRVIDAFCPICMEAFRDGSEVLLSCSHIFHRQCLGAFEKFMKTTRSCPICRTLNYQKRMTRVGSNSYKAVCATRIQCLYRGFKARKRFKVGLRELYRCGGGNLRRKKEFYEKELSSYTSQLSKDINDREDELLTVIESVDTTLLESRQLDMLFDSLMGHRISALDLAERRQTEDMEDRAAKLSIYNTSHLSEPVRSCTGGGSESDFTSEVISKLTEKQWVDVHDIAVARGLGECAICMVNNVDTQGNYRGARKLVLLSCSHVFHQQCMKNFELFSRDNRVCPCCRYEYETHTFDATASAFHRDDYKIYRR